MEDTTRDFHHGDMPVAAQTHTYELFNRLTKWVSLHAAVVILIFSLWFCVGADFLGGLIPGLVVWGLGLFFLRSRPETIEP